MVGRRTWRNRASWMAFLVWGFGSSLAAQTLVSDSLLQARTHWVWTGGALWGSQPTWGVNWHGFS
ncbi:MAG: hypothetical protein QF427_05545, partial [Flavobacteriales bacterium]|nr:hypothetical protein [Flavobacteriales bacterium]